MKNCNEKTHEKIIKSQCYNNQGGQAIYGLGFIGAAIYFIGQATTFWAGIVGLLQAIVWPAFLVYDAFKFLVK